MKRITADHWQLERSAGANGYVIRSGDRTAVVDPGMASKLDAVRAELREHEAETGRVTDIVLTHYDVDHSGVAAALQRALDVPVWLGAADAAILRGEVRPPTRVRRFLARVAKVEYPAGVVDASGLDLPGVTVIPTPGHTPGHVALRTPTVLLTGDAVIVKDGAELAQFFAPLISDRAEAVASERVLREQIAAHPIEWVLSGHNPPRRVRR